MPTTSLPSTPDTDLAFDRHPTVDWLKAEITHSWQASGRAFDKVSELGAQTGAGDNIVFANVRERFRVSDDTAEAVKKFGDEAMEAQHYNSVVSVTLSRLRRLGGMLAPLSEEQKERFRERMLELAERKTTHGEPSRSTILELARAIKKGTTL